MLSYPRKSAQKYAINLTFPKDWVKKVDFRNQGHSVAETTKNQKKCKKMKKSCEKVCKFNFLSYLCNPNQQSGGGEMVDTLLWGGSGSNPVRVRVSPTALHFTWGSFERSFLFFCIYSNPGIPIRGHLDTHSVHTLCACQTLGHGDRVLRAYMLH